MAGAKLVKPNAFRGKIFDKLAEAFGTSVLGMYEGKLRVEWIDEGTGEVVQFSVAPVVHKTTIDEVECDKLVPIAEQIAVYEAAVAAKAGTKTKTTTTKTKTTTDKGVMTGKVTADEVSYTVDGKTFVSPSTPPANVELSPEEAAKLEELNKMLLKGEF